MRVYIINRRDTRKKLDDRSHRGFFMGYAATTGVILYCKPDQSLLFTEPIMVGLMNIILASPYKTSTVQVPYSFGKILKVIFMIHISVTLFHANLILHPLHLVMRQLSYMTLSYLPLERKLVLIYWMTNILQSLTSLILSPICQLVINFHNRLREMCGL